MRSRQRCRCARGGLSSSTGAAIAVVLKSATTPISKATAATRSASAKEAVSVIEQQDHARVPGSNPPTRRTDKCRDRAHPNPQRVKVHTFARRRELNHERVAVHEVGIEPHRGERVRGHDPGHLHVAGEELRRRQQSHTCCREHKPHLQHAPRAKACPQDPSKPG